MRVRPTLRAQVGRGTEALPFTSAWHRVNQQRKSPEWISNGNWCCVSPCKGPSVQSTNCHFAEEENSDSETWSPHVAVNGRNRPELSAGLLLHHCFSTPVFQMRILRLAGNQSQPALPHPVPCVRGDFKEGERYWPSTQEEALWGDPVNSGTKANACRWQADNRNGESGWPGKRDPALWLQWITTGWDHGLGVVYSRENDKHGFYVRSAQVFKYQKNHQVLCKPNQDICESSSTYTLLWCPTPRRHSGHADWTGLGTWPGPQDFYNLPRWSPGQSWALQREVMITVSMGVNWGLEMQDLESYHMPVHLQDSTELKLLILSRLPPPHEVEKSWSRERAQAVRIILLVFTWQTGKATARPNTLPRHSPSCPPSKHGPTSGRQKSLLHASFCAAVLLLLSLGTKKR